LEALAKFQQIEFEDVELSFDELELRLSPGMVMSSPAATPSPQILKTVKPTQLLEAQVGIPPGEYRGKVGEVRLGATKAEGGTRSRSFIIGGETAPAFYNFQAKTPNMPIISMDVFDWEKVPLAKAVKMHFREVVADPAESGKSWQTQPNGPSCASRSSTRT